MVHQYIIISGLNLHDNNRGTAALGYGAVSFLCENGFLKKGMDILNVRPYKNIFKRSNRIKKTEIITVNGFNWEHVIVGVFFIEWLLLLYCGIRLPWTRLGHIIRHVKYVAAINGGDGFSDIYNTKTFLSRLPDTLMALKKKIPYIILPQTLGPFEYESNKKIAERILCNAKYVFVRDNKFVAELNRMGVKYEITKDLSYYMQPQPFDIKIRNKAVGINVSGLAYSNSFRTLAGQFDAYPYLIKVLIESFQKLGCNIYLIPHSYNYQLPEDGNDDIIAIRKAYESLNDKTNVFKVDMDLISPKQKYVISRMTYFVGTRMHANFAAIYTGVPLFGLAYSYKFEGAFEANGLHGKTAMINNIGKDTADAIVKTIIQDYLSQLKQ